MPRKADARWRWLSTEQPIINALRRTKCGQIAARVIGVDGHRYYSLLESMTGTIDDVVPAYAQWLRTQMEADPARAGYVVQAFVAWRTWNDVEDEELAMDQFADTFYQTLAAVHIVEEVRKQVRCLLDHNPDHVYTDMKVANILFKRARDGKRIEIRVGDLGSMSQSVDVAYDRTGRVWPFHDGMHPMTYPCIPSGAAFQRFATIDDKKRCLSFQLGLLLARLVGVDIGYFVHSKKKVRADQRTHMMRVLQTLQSVLRPVMRFVAPRLADLIHPDPHRRPSLDASFWRTSRGRPSRSQDKKEADTPTVRKRETNAHEDVGGWPRRVWGYWCDSRRLA